ncbi:molybdenum ABC transporter ATP-binding protein [Niveibacterium terrae]|uniref:molybdenum ABC transporter ATP-binding protein n=1 Tax=Niveibacterium terrae TaxID=3373598 RepID=UPI003A905DC6
MPDRAPADPSSLMIRFAVSYADFALELALELPGRGVTALFGRSGSGKTTCLRAIAGLQRARDAYVAIGEELWQDDSAGLFVPVHRRSLGYVFQEASLFPHLSVRGNLDYAQRRVPRGAQRVPFEQAVSLLGVEALLDRRPAGLSGGERQRVAIARALLTSPRLLLMDEPLAALDSQSKAAILPYLEKMHDALAIPVLYVTHSVEELARLADHMVLFEAGRVIASGPLREVLTRLDLPTARGDDSGVVIEARVALHDPAYAQTRLEFPGGSLWVGRLDKALGDSVRVRVLARDVSLALAATTPSSILNVLPAKIVEIHDDGPERVNVLLKLGDEGSPLLARITRRSRDLLALATGQSLFAQVKSVALLA